MSAPLQQEPYQAMPDYVNTPVLKEMYANTPFVVRGDVCGYERMPVRVMCQFCGYDVVTQVVFKTGTGTHVIAGGTCMVGCVSLNNSVDH